MEEEYRIELPGTILVGEGKPNNQNHAVIFTRGEALQVCMRKNNNINNENYVLLTDEKHAVLCIRGEAMGR
jgi:callose synthase